MNGKRRSRISCRFAVSGVWLMAALPPEAATIISVASQVSGARNFIFMVSRMNRQLHIEDIILVLRPPSNGSQGDRVLELGTVGLDSQSDDFKRKQIGGTLLTGK